MPGRVVSAIAILCFSASVQSTPIANAYTQLYVLANGGCTDAPDFDSCSGTIEPTEQTVASLSRTFAGDQADAIANLETQELKARIIDTGPVSTNQAFARIAEGYRFDPLTSAATFDFEYLFEGVYSGLSLDGNRSFADLTIQLIGHGALNDIPIIMRSLADVAGGQEIIKQTISLAADTFALDVTMSLNLASIEGGTVDVFNTAGYSISFAQDFGEVTRISGLPLDSGASVPLPGSIALLGLGLLILGWSRRQKA